MSEQLYHDMVVRMADGLSSDFVKLSASKHVALQFFKRVELGCSVSMTPHHKSALLYIQMSNDWIRLDHADVSG